MNLLGTCQSNRVGADIAATKKKMKRGTYKSMCWQHKTENLNVALWSDNNIVTKLSNYYSPTFLDATAGMKRRKKDAKGDQEREQTDVTFPEQKKDYSNIFHQIDNRNGKEQTYDLKLESKTHNWSSKLVFRMFGVNSSNAVLFYYRLV